MRGSWRSLVIATALALTVGAGVSAAQTVTVIKAPAGGSVELVLNTAVVASTTAGPDGMATLDLNLSARRGRTEIDANIFVDACDTLRRVLLVEPGVQGMPVPGDCTRQEISGTYIVREVTSFVINVSGPLPTARFRQGNVPDSWLRPELERTGSQPREWGPKPTGLIAFGGGGLAMFRDQVFVACGDAPDCSGKDSRFAYTGGIDIWFTPNLAAEVSYLKPADVTAQGSGTGYSFSNDLSTQMLTAAGKFGIPAGPLRLYGKGGITYYRVESVTTETIDDYTIAVNGVDQTIAGGTQTFGLNVKTWRYFFGGGVEIWPSKRIGIYGEMIRTPIKGDSTEGGEGFIDDAINSVLAGIKVKIGR